MFGLIKTVFFLILFSVTLIVCIEIFAPKWFEFNTLKKCPSPNQYFKGLCANVDFQKGDAVGLIYTITSPTKFKESQYGKLVDHSTRNNIDLVTVQYKDHIDVYGYANKKILKGETLTVNFTALSAPKPNPKSDKTSPDVAKFFKK